MGDTNFERIQALAENQEFVEKIVNATSDEELFAVMEAYDLQLTESELKALLSQTFVSGEDGELSEEALENVNGGGSVWNWFKSCIKNIYEKRREKNTRAINGMISRL